MFVLFVKISVSHISKTLHNVFGSDERVGGQVIPRRQLETVSAC